jgi:hypothetical protein
MEEKPIYAVTVKKPKSFGRWDTYTLVLTDRRIIIAQLTAKMLNEAAAEANREGKSEGKGFFERWGDQLKTTSAYSKKYLDMEPEKILQEDSDNFALENSDIKKIGIKRTSVPAGLVKGLERVSGAEITIESKGRKLSYQTSEYAEKLQDALKQVFGDRVKIG